MSRPRYWLNLAAYISRLKQDDRRYYIGAVGIRSDGCTVSACNGNPKEPDRLHHCEYRLCRKLDKGSTVYLARTLADGTWGTAKPCPDCLKVLRTRGVRTVFYTIGEDEYGTMTP